MLCLESDAKKSKLSKSPSHHAACGVDTRVRDKTKTAVDTGCGPRPEERGEEEREDQKGEEERGEEEKGEGREEERGEEAKGEGREEEREEEEKGEGREEERGEEEREERVAGGEEWREEGKCEEQRNANELEKTEQYNQSTIEICGRNVNGVIVEDVNVLGTAVDATAVSDNRDAVCDCSSAPKMKPVSDPNSRLSPVQSASLSPPDCSTVTGGVCEGGGGEEGAVVMSEEEEGPLDSSIEDLPSSPSLAPLISATDTEGQLLHIVPFVCAFYTRWGNNVAHDKQTVTGCT